jgi:hypothetical protein
MKTLPSKMYYYKRQFYALNNFGKFIPLSHRIAKLFLLKFDGVGDEKALRDAEAEANRILAELKLQEVEPPMPHHLQKQEKMLRFWGQIDNPPTPARQVKLLLAVWKPRKPQNPHYPHPHSVHSGKW